MHSTPTHICNDGQLCHYVEDAVPRPNVLCSLRHWPPLCDSVLVRVKTDLHPVVEERKQRSNRKGCHKDCDKAKLDNFLQVLRKEAELVLWWQVKVPLPASVNVAFNPLLREVEDPVLDPLEKGNPQLNEVIQYLFPTEDDGQLDGHLQEATVGGALLQAKAANALVVARVTNNTG